MSKQGFPSKNPAGNGLTGMLQLMLEKHKQNTQNRLPAKVVNYDRKKNLAKVQPQIAVLTTEGEIVPRAVIASVPVLALGGGGFVINFPLKPGDLGWIEASDRDISLFMQTLKESRPNTLRKHTFEDGHFVPDIFYNYSLDSEDEDANMVIQSRDARIRVAIWPDRVKTTAGDTWHEVNQNGVITASAPKSVFYDTPLVQFAGIFQSGVGGGNAGAGGTSVINGGLRATKKILSEEDVVAVDVSLKSHPHSGVEPGGGQSGPPVGGA
ncbi:hypothetical protein LJC36_00280 [Desulfovibrio sp. OttesenSCG-928-C14]|nr:hypothetical protein [Desulfovibrio sp. OttesenSCG-928-C14]